MLKPICNCSLLEFKNLQLIRKTIYPSWSMSFSFIENYNKSEETRFFSVLIHLAY